jgi:hypothetical protein
VEYLVPEAAHHTAISARVATSGGQTATSRTGCAVTHNTLQHGSVVDFSFFSVCPCVDLMLLGWRIVQQERGIKGSSKAKKRKGEDLGPRMWRMVLHYSLSQFPVCRFIFSNSDDFKNRLYFPSWCESKFRNSWRKATFHILVCPPVSADPGQVIMSHGGVVVVEIVVVVDVHLPLRLILLLVLVPVLVVLLITMTMVVVVMNDENLTLEIETDLSCLLRNSLWLHSQTVSSGGATADLAVAPLGVVASK